MNLTFIPLKDVKLTCLTPQVSNVCPFMAQGRQAGIELLSVRLLTFIGLHLVNAFMAHPKI